MKTTVQWLDAAKHRLGIESDYALAKTLGIGHSVISNYRNGRSSMDSYMAARIAELIGEDPLKVIASAEAERARNADQRAFWKRLAACVLIAAGAGAVLPPTPAQAALYKTPAERTPTREARGEYTLCAPPRRRRSSSPRRALAALQAALFPVKRSLFLF